MKKSEKFLEKKNDTVVLAESFGTPNLNAYLKEVKISGDMREKKIQSFNHLNSLLLP